MDNKLFTKYKLGKTTLQNRIVMAPMTRSRATGNIPNDLMAQYYGQRSDAGLIITEGTSPSPNGLGYSRIPGIFSKEQIEGWKKVTAAAHKGGTRILIQLMHTGRVGHKLNLPEGAKILSPSPLKIAGHIWTDQKQLQDYPLPEGMTANEITETKKEYVTAALNAIEAGFDGVEIHGANGYLPEQFLSPISNVRTDNYGGSIENRSRFILEVAEEASSAIGKERMGIRLSPYGVSNGMRHYPEIDSTYKYLIAELDKIGIAHVHLVDHSSMGAPAVPSDMKNAIRKLFRNTLILSGGYNFERAEADLQNNKCDLIAFGRPFINNPDLVERFRNDWLLASNLNTDLFYTPGPKGYTDYPSYKEAAVTSR